MDYECPECKSNEEPKIIIHFPPKIYQCLMCGRKGSREDFLKNTKRSPGFTQLPKPP